MNANPENILAVLDVGTSKVECLIAERRDDGVLEYRGMGTAQLVDAIQSGNVRDLEAVEKAIRAAVGKAEKLARVTVGEVVVSFRGGEPESQVVEAEITTVGEVVTDGDIQTVTDAAFAQVELSEGRTILQTVPAAYLHEGEYHHKPPVGLFGQSLGVSLHVTTVREGPLRNLEMAVRKAQLNVAGVVQAGYASALAVMSADETRMGAACVDMGAGRTDISLFYMGALMHHIQLPLGGHGVTDVIMRELMTTHGHAETIKIKYGAAICDSADMHRHIDVVRAGEGEDTETTETVSKLTHAMQSAFELRMEDIRAALSAAGFTGEYGRRVVLTGGVAQTPRLEGLADRVLEREVRIGEPSGVKGLPAVAGNAAFACLVGLMRYAAQMPTDGRGMRQKKNGQPKGAFGRLFGWMKESF